MNAEEAYQELKEKYDFANLSGENFEKFCEDVFNYNLLLHGEDHVRKFAMLVGLNLTQEQLSYLMVHNFRMYFKHLEGICSKVNKSVEKIKFKSEFERINIVKLIIKSNPRYGLEKAVLN